jgi:uncharacterized protein (DUF488 family)
MKELFTIGHSSHTIERFIQLLEQHGVSAIADVRSSPYSRFSPQFNREPLQAVLQRANIQYVYLGKELGARSTDPACIVDSKVQFGLLAKSALFQKGLERLRQGIESFRISLLCAEKDPITCHRTILVCRSMRGPGLAIKHILEDGRIEENSVSERRLLHLLNIPETDLFASEEEIISKAYDIQGSKIAYVDEGEKK